MTLTILVPDVSPLRTPTFVLVGFDDWMKELKQGDVLELCGATEPTAGTVRVRAVDKWEGALALVPSYVLEQHLEPLCRAFWGLHARLTMARGARIELNEAVTAVIFRVEKEEPLVKLASPDDLRRIERN